MHSNAPVLDAAFRCPQCNYNLTGLPQPRCPECGAQFTWDDIHRRAAQAPAIAFERLTGVQKIPGFVLTWFTLLLLPWKFAAQAVQRIDLFHAATFGLLCFASTSISFAFGAGGSHVGAWILTGLIYIVLQALLLALVDWPHWTEWRTSVTFWLAIGGYTSAIVVTECTGMPPIIGVSDLQNLLAGRSTFSSILPNPSWLAILQLALWLIGLAFIVLARLRTRRVSLLTSILVSLAAAIALLWLYAFSVEHIGMSLYEAFDRFFATAAGHFAGADFNVCPIPCRGPTPPLRQAPSVF